MEFTEEYLQEQEERLLRKYRCQTIDELLNLLREKLREKQLVESSTIIH